MLTITWNMGDWDATVNRVYALLDRHTRDGLLSESELGLEAKGRPGLRPDTLAAALDGVDYRLVRELDRSAWAYQLDDKERDEVARTRDGWKTATIVTAATGAALILLGILLLLTGVGAGAAVAFFVGGVSAVASPICAAEWHDATAALAEKEARNRDHRELLQGQLRECLEAAPPRAPTDPWRALAPP